MLFLNVFLLLFLHLAHAASIISRSQSYPLDSTTLGPKSDLVIANYYIAPDGLNRSTTLAGGTFPGPIIAAKKGDKFDINVVNKLSDDDQYKVTTVHWHGIYQNGSNYMDGMSMVTQCPIAQNDSFLYSFSAQQQTGTYWYHSHYSTQTCDGLRGPLIIYDPEDPLAHLYDVDDETTVITLADWYHTVAPVLNHFIGVHVSSSLINGAGRYQGGPLTDLAVINVEHGKRYRLRLIGLSCHSNFIFSVDYHDMKVIEADGEETEPLLVDSLQILPGQRYSVVLEANQPVDNYWLRALPDIANATFSGGQNVAIVRYKGAPIADPTRNDTMNSTMPLVETNLHALIDPGVPGIPGYGNADINLMMVMNLSDHGIYTVNNVTYLPPTVPVLLQILSGAQEATDLLPSGSVYVLQPNKVVELTMQIAYAGGPHPIHIHGHSFHVVQSAGNSSFNYINPVRRDVVSAGILNQQMVIRWVTDNPGPWFLHCHIDWHLQAGFAVVMAESPSETKQHTGDTPNAWDNLCPIYDVLTPHQIGAENSYQEALNLTSPSLLFPPNVP
ncbi:hypothetical protein AZE42_10149 [Rhizopogon vesiculosus]|uniref:Laccase n=1 Tax=Rhizopogon vesiculosus TaxID=180088 RepID=A0A1J8QKX0_9AGAM|nr:hypothetical protein AZE42_10149 [Rhizopogon vesiculosus]